MNKLLRRIGYWLGRLKVEAELAEEIEFHRTLKQKELEESGFTRNEAMAGATRSMGNTLIAREDSRSVWISVWLEQLVQDVRFAARQLRLSPGFAILAVLTIAIAIGIVTTLFSVTYGVLLKPLPWPEPDRLIRPSETREGATRQHPLNITNATYNAWQDHSSTIESIGGYYTGVSTLTGAGETARLQVARVTGSIFAVLRARPLLGSVFTADDEAKYRTLPAVILSYGLWQDRFGGDPAILGKTVELDGISCPIVAVMPRDFVFPDSAIRAWMPYQVRPVLDSDGHGTSAQAFGALARLRPGVSPAQAAAEATARAQTAPSAGNAWLALYGSNGAAQITAQPALAALTTEVRSPLLALMAAVLLLLLTAIANVASLQLARASSRHREMAIRSAIGAGTMRMTRQLLVESLLLGGAGGVTGLFIAAALHRALPSLMPSDFPRLEDVSLSLGVALFTFALTFVTGLLVGILPVSTVRHLNVVGSLTEDGNGSVGATRGRTPRLRLAIMTGQVAIACVLLIGAALLSRSFLAMMHADRGYAPDNLLTAVITMPTTSFTTERQIQVLDAIEERLASIPGVRQVAYTDGLPLTTNETTSGWDMPSPRSPGQTINAHAIRHVVSESYVSAIGMRLVAGRSFDRSDTAASSRVVVVNRAFAQQYLTERALGDKIRNFAGSNAVGDYEVVGIIDNVIEHRIAETPQPEVYSLQRQTIFRSTQPGLILRTDRDPRGLIDSVKTVVRNQESAASLDSIMTMEDRLSSSLATPRRYAMILSVFAVSALSIAAVGLFGVLSYSVAQRSREIAVRAALGASPLDTIRLVLKQGMLVTAAGLAVGVWLSLLLSRYLTSQLYGVRPGDWLSYTGVCVVVMAISAIACLLPALRAARIDPLRALR